MLLIVLKIVASNFCIWLPLRSASIEVALTEFRENATKTILQMVDTVQDAETQDVLLESMEDITKGEEQ